VQKTDALSFLTEVMDMQDNQDLSSEETIAVLDQRILNLKKKARGYDLYRLQDKLSRTHEFYIKGDLAALLGIAMPILPITDRDLAYNFAVDPATTRLWKNPEHELQHSIVLAVVGYLMECVETALEVTRRECTYAKD
jgi:hypothetical protein